MAIKIHTGRNTDLGVAHGDEEFEITYEGAVLGTYERNGYDDSDFYAVVWTGAGLSRVCYATTRGWTYLNSATADLTPENEAALREWYVAKRAADAVAADKAAAARVALDRTVVVTGGRKIAKGTTAEVVWIGEDRYARHSSLLLAAPRRLGLRLSDGSRAFISETNVKVANPEQYEHPVATVVAEASRYAERATVAEIMNSSRVFMLPDGSVVAV